MKLFLFCFSLILASLSFTTDIYANSLILSPALNISIGDPENPTGVVDSLQILFLFSIISLAPSLLVTMTAFTRIIIVLHFIRSALGTQQMPPNQVLIGLALFLTMHVMAPTFEAINENALQPYAEGLLSQSEAIELGMEPLRQFMSLQVGSAEVLLFAALADAQFDPENIPNSVLIPAFILHEITQGFLAGFLIFIPFIIVDMVVASILMAMGMMMLPPAMISLPFKILLFILVDGWNLILGTIVATFR